MSKVILTEKLFLGKGWHKATYIDPRNDRRCIKIVHHEHVAGEDTDLARELWYRRSRDFRHLKSKLLTEYYGTVETNLGTGYVFERIVDFDGNNSLNFKEFFDQQNLRKDHEQAIHLTVRVLEAFKKEFFQEKIITTNMQYENFVVQCHKPHYQEFSVRIIDNIGSPVLIPLFFFIDFLAYKRCKKYWQKFLDDLPKDYPKLFTNDVLQSL